MIEALTPADTPEYARMRYALWPDCSQEMHALEIAEQKDVFVFRRTTGLGAFIELSIRNRVDGSMSERVGYVEGWYVDPDLRGQGIGAQLIKAAEEWTRSLGLTELASDAELENESSIAAHKALGFHETFRLVHFLKKLT